MPSNLSKHLITFTNPGKSPDGLWSALSFPWQLLLPWQTPGTGLITWTNTPKT